MKKYWIYVPAVLLVILVIVGFVKINSLEHKVSALEDELEKAKAETVASVYETEATSATEPESEKEDKTEETESTEFSDETSVAIETTIENETEENTDTTNRKLKYLAIGNSITTHSECDYWWDDSRGMAASKDENDYVHIVAKALKAKVDVIGMPFWEVNSHDRAEYLSMLDSYLNMHPDIITIQLGENAHDLVGWERDWCELLNYINKRTKSKVLVIGDFWEEGNRDSIKAAAAKNCHATFISLDEIKDNKEYFAGMGTVIYDDEGNRHFVDHAGVSRHPNDKAMKYIADRILENI